MTICLNVVDVSGLSNLPQGGARTSWRQGDGDARNSVCPRLPRETLESGVRLHKGQAHAERWCQWKHMEGVLWVFPATLGNAVKRPQEKEVFRAHELTCMDHVKWLCQH